MPAAAVIPAPKAYIKVVAVKKLVVELWVGACGPLLCAYCCGPIFPSGELRRARTFTLKKLECSKQAIA